MSIGATRVLFGLLAASLSCASEPARPGAADGLTEVVDAASSDGFPGCLRDPSAQRIEATFLQADGNDVRMSIDAAVTVTASESCAAATCPSGVDQMARRIALTAADGQRWDLYLRYDLPAGLLEVGDPFDLTVDTRNMGIFGISHTVVLAREGRLVLFAAPLKQIGELPLPRLEAFGIQISDGGSTCHVEAGPAHCSFHQHAVRVTVGADSAVVAGGQTARVGWLSFTSGGALRYVNVGGCDQVSTATMVGHRAP